jgi:hypothetical protein
MGNSFVMDSWYDIVKSYDDPQSKYQNKKNDGTYSQSSVVILLIYLTFGEDHPYHIAKYFEDIYFDRDEEIRYSSNLRTAKVGSLLNRMKEDELVTVFTNKVKGKVVKTYSINPRIIQSPIRYGTYSKSDGSIFEIPLGMVEQLLAWKDCKYEESKKVCERDEFFQVVCFPEMINYLRFLEFLWERAAYYDMENQNKRNADSRISSPLEELLLNYDKEVRALCGGICVIQGSGLIL